VSEQLRLDFASSTSALFEPIVNPELAPIAELPFPTFTLRASRPADGAQQSSLLPERSDCQGTRRC
jgi:hypothetical protein